MSIGHDYGVCCPASLQIQKAGQCPNSQLEINKELCGQVCKHDLECHSIQKCCESATCGKHCVHPQNLTGKNLSIKILAVKPTLY